MNMKLSAQILSPMTNPNVKNSQTSSAPLPRARCFEGSDVNIKYRSPYLLEWLRWNKSYD
jgi:hypothetical protein